MVFSSPILFKTFFREEIRAFAFWPFIFIKHRDLIKDKVLLNHEKIHLKQQLELLVVPFYVLYFGEFIYHLIRFKSIDKAYKAISFEKEAYNHHHNRDYLASRRFWAMWR